MKHFLLATLSILIYQIAFSQPCIPGGITFDSQTEIDNFQENYPNCTEIEGSVDINGNEIYNLIGLSVITSIGDYLAISENDNLKNFHGLHNIESIGGSMFLMGIDGIHNFSGFESLMNIGGILQIGYCDSLENLSGMNSLSYIGGDILIQTNFQLHDLTGIENLSSTGGGLSFYNNDFLASLNGFQYLNSIGGSISIYDNDILENIDGINNIQSSSIENLIISENDYLSICEIESICNYLASPSGIITISNNNSGCNSVDEVESACENVLIEEFNQSELFEIFPNPANVSLTIKNGKELKIKQINIYNQLGEKVNSIEINDKKIDISILDQGLYIVEIIAKGIIFKEKLIVR